MTWMQEAWSGKMGAEMTQSSEGTKPFPRWEDLVEGQDGERMATA
jgi:hypothetical protein